MAKWTISKIFSFVIFLAMMVLFFLWITNQTSDLGLFFGFRTSHTVANDIANLITSLSGVPGDAETTYSISPGPAAQNPFRYDIDVSSKIVCVRSYLGGGEERATRDCATFPFELTESEVFKTGDDGKLNLKIKKTIDPTTKESCIEISADSQSTGGCVKSA